MCEYKDKFKKIENFEELFDFREELLQKEMEISRIFDSGGRTDDRVKEIQNVNFWIQHVEIRIRYLFVRGYSIDKIVVEKEEEPTIKLIEKDINK
ncbi:MAG: hypothetical protein WAT79_08730 [Saprospiraceae bacterium]